MSKKKSFLNLPTSQEQRPPVDQFISVLSEPKPSEEGSANASMSSTGLTPQPIDRHNATALLKSSRQEKKDKHFHLVLKPSLFKRIEAASSKSKVSMNKFLTVGAELLLSSVEKKQNND